MRTSQWEADASGSKVSQSKQQHVLSLLNAWRPFGRSISLSGVQAEDGSIVSDPQSMEEALLKAWEEKLTCKPVATDGLSQFLRHQFDMAALPPPIYAQAEHVVRKYANKDTAPVSARHRWHLVRVLVSCNPLHCSLAYAIGV